MTSKGEEHVVETHGDKHTTAQDGTHASDWEREWRCGWNKSKVFQPGGQLGPVVLGTWMGYSWDISKGLQPRGKPGPRGKLGPVGFGIGIWGLSIGGPEGMLDRGLG